MTSSRAHVRPLRLSAALAALVVAGATGAVATASAPPVGALPPGPAAALVTQKGQLVAVALPHRPGGRVWRIARPFNGQVLRQVSEGDIGANVVLVFRAAGRGTTTLAFGLTVGETRKAYESRRFAVRVR